jgi:NAD(P)-dependent dehydrogenase (short-subunit alcohol dehydrogenase family)
VTGGGTGLGLTTATALSENGCRVYITGRRLEPLQAASRDGKDGKGAIIPIQADVSTKEGITSEFVLDIGRHALTGRAPRRDCFEGEVHQCASQ